MCVTVHFSVLPPVNDSVHVHVYTCICTCRLHMSIRLVVTSSETVADNETYMYTCRIMWCFSPGLPPFQCSLSPHNCIAHKGKGLERRLHIKCISIGTFDIISCLSLLHTRPTYILWVKYIRVFPLFPVMFLSPCLNQVHLHVKENQYTVRRDKSKAKAVVQCIYTCTCMCIC